ncbi:MAG: hypothetical protein CM15mP21_5870 [Hyphomicrobiales bacterium]|nr:MAG: hypothetical protein CM15mP21_5870 [Hyphomicrobiales bacterium]
MRDTRRKTSNHLSQQGIRLPHIYSRNAAKRGFFLPRQQARRRRSINRIEKLVLKHPAQQIDIFVQGRVLFAQLFNFAHRMNDCCVVAAAKFTPDFGQ